MTKRRWVFSQGVASWGVLLCLTGLLTAGHVSAGTVVAWGRNNQGQCNVPSLRSNVVAISAGGDCHSMALKSDRTVAVWGSAGSLRAVPENLTNATAIAAGYAHSLALRSDGTVAAWGSSAGTNLPAGLSNVAAIAAGYRHSLALRSDGTVAAWGSSAGTNLPAGLSQMAAIAAGVDFSLALCTTGTVTAWGTNNYGQCNVPAGLNNVMAVAAGMYHSLALRADGTVAAWGGNTYGQCNIPAGLSNVVAISAGYYFSLALKADGTVVAWGSNSSGLCDVPEDLTNVVAISAGCRVGLALKSDGTIVAWGTSAAGQDDLPEELTETVTVAAGMYHSLAVNADGTVAQWGGMYAIGLHDETNIIAVSGGQNFTVALRSDGTVAQWGSYAASLPAGLSNVVKIAAGYYGHTLALRADGTVIAWGENSSGECNVPAGLRGIVAIAAGGHHCLVLKSDGTIVSWGYNSYGQTNVPAGLSNVVAIAAGYVHNLALKSDGTVVAWGQGLYGQTNVPAGLSNVVAIAAGEQHSLALKADGTVVAWGTNTDGQCDVPAGLSNVVAIAAGEYHSLALVRTVPREEDVTAPEIFGCGDQTLTANEPAGFTLMTQMRVFDDNDPAPPVTYSRPVLLPVGQTTMVTATVWDASGNTNLCEYAVTVVPDTAPPVITGCVDRTFWITNGGGAAFNYEWIGIEDDADPDPVVEITPPAGTWLPEGTNQIEVRTWDASGNTNVCQFALAIRPVAVAAWGNNSDSQCRVPVGLTEVVAIAAGVNHSLALRPDGTITAWGSTNYGKCTVPAGLSNVVALAAGDQHSLALRADGTVAVWGYPSQGVTNIPTGLSNVVAIAAGGYFNLALKSDGTVAAWGNNSEGQCAVPANLCHVVAIAAKNSYGLALKSDGTVVAWGTGSPTNVPAGLSDVVAIAAGGYHSLALKSDGTVAAWGYGYYGQTNVPAGLSNVVAIAAGYHNLALRSDGTVVSWGYNNYGQTNVPAGLSNVTAVAAGYYHSLAMIRTVPLTEDVAAPAIYGCEDRTVFAETPEGTPWVPKVRVFDDRDPAPAVVYDPVELPVGQTVVTATAWDASGNTNQCQFTMTVISDTEPPAITGCMDRTERIIGGGGTVVDYDWMGFSDNADPNFMVEFDPPAGTWLPEGTHAIEVQAWDASGNTNACSFALTLQQAAVAAWGTNNFSQCNVSTNLDSIVAVAAGTYRQLALHADGMVEAWGYNYTNVPAELSNVVAIAVGDYHNLTLKSDGTVAAWGSGSQTNVPAGLSNVVAVAAGAYHSLALRSDGTVVAWGSNGQGQTNVPARLNGVVAVAGGDYHSLALKTDGTVVAWGYNSNGQTNVPAGLSNVVAVAAGNYHSLALKTDGTVVAWGNNDYGQCTVPAGLSNVVAITAGGYHSVALKADGTVTAWGNNNAGQCTVPSGLSNVVAIAAGEYHNLVLIRTVPLAEDLAAPVIYGCGDRSVTAGSPAGYSFLTMVRVLDNTDPTPEVAYDRPAVLPIGDTVVTVTATDASGNTNQCQFTVTVAPDTVPPEIVGCTNRTVWIYGGGGATAHYTGLATRDDADPDYVEEIDPADGSWLAEGTNQVVVRAWDSSGNTNICQFSYIVRQVEIVGWGYTNYGICTPPASLSNVVALAGGYNHTLALRADGTVAVWGSGSATNIPVGLSNVAAVAAGFSHNLALRANGKVVAWGGNSSGQTNVPAGLSDVVAIAGGGSHSLALKADGTVAAWGYNSNGQTNVPAGLTGVVAIAAGEYHSLALKADGTVVAWGNDGSGQCTVPAWLSGVVAIAAGGYHSLALCSDGTVAAWGANGNGQLNVPAGLSNVVGIAAGEYYNLALRADGTVVAWGFGSATNVPAALSDAVAIAAGPSHSLALLHKLPMLSVPTVRGVMQTSAVLGAGVTWRNGDAPLTERGTFWGTEPDPAEHMLAEGGVAVGVYRHERTGLPAGTLIHVRGYAVNSQGTYYSADGSFWTIPPDPEAQTAGSVAPTSFSAQWLVAAGATNYLLDVSTNAAFDGYVSSYGVVNSNRSVGNVTAFTVSGLSPNMSYYYRVRAQNSSGTSGNSGTIAVTTTPATPTVSAATDISTGGFTAHWSVSTGATNYLLDVATNTSFVDFVSGYSNCALGNVTNWPVTGLAANCVYYYRVRAQGGGGTSGNSGTVTVWTTLAPPAAAGATSIRSTGFTANWLASPGATSYRLDISTDALFADYVSGYSNCYVGNVTNQEVNGLSPSCAYYYRVRAQNSHSTSADSDPIAVLTVPAAPTAQAATEITESGFTANWAASAGATNYLLDVATDGGFANFVEGYQDLSSGDVLATPVTGLSAGSNYYYRVRAQNSGGASANSGTMAVATIPAAPVAGEATEITEISFTANWAASPGATNYLLDVATDEEFTTFVDGYQDLSVGAAVSQFVAGLSPDTTYYYRVRAQNRGGTSSDSETMEVPTIPDATPPLIYGCDNVNASTFDGSAVAVSYEVSAADNADPAPTVVCDPESGSLFPLGETPVTVTVWDMYGNTNTCEFTVAVSLAQVVAWGNNDSGQCDVPAGLTDVVAAEAGSYHGLALKSDGTVVAWGNDDYGQCDVPEELADVVRVSGGDQHSLALKSDGTVAAWGLNEFGECDVPEDLAGVVAVSAGSGFSLALTANGTVRAWGNNESGQCNAPSYLTDVTAIDAGSNHGMALRADGTVVVWGENGNGQCAMPADLTGVVAVAAGDVHSLALKSDGTVVAWGNDEYGQCDVPEDLTDVVSIAAGQNHSMACRADGTVDVWGDNDSGQGEIPEGLSGVAAVSAGQYHSLALIRTASLEEDVTAPAIYGDEDRSIQAFSPDGIAAACQVRVFDDIDPRPIVTYDPPIGSLLPVGDTVITVTTADASGNSAESSFTVTVAFSPVAAWGLNDGGQCDVPEGLTDVAAVAAGYQHSLALLLDGTVAAWGNDDSGQCDVPEGLADVVAIACGNSHSLALKADGTVAAWGDDGSGQCDVLEGLTDIVAIAAGESFSLALKANGTLSMWGTNGREEEFNVPGDLNDVVAISAGGGHAMALRADGTVVVWGNNDYGQCDVPEDVTDVVAISAGWQFSLALKSDGTVVAWGCNDYGECDVPGDLADVVAIAAGEMHSVAVRADGTAMVWGNNEYGQWNMPAGLAGVATISAGGEHSLALVQMPPAEDDDTPPAIYGCADRIVVTAAADGAPLACQVRVFDDFDARPAVTYDPPLGTLLPLGDTVVAVTAEDASGNISSCEFTVTVRLAEVIAWGNNDYGQCDVPRDLTGVAAIAAGETHGLALLADGTVATWGYNDYGQCDVPEDLTDVVAITGGDLHSLALKSDGTVVAWGENAENQCSVPEDLTNAVAISAGSSHSLALKSDGTVAAWGEDGDGKLSGAETLTDIVAIAAGDSHSIALRSDGTVVGWGGNGYGECDAPDGLADVAAIAAGDAFSLALRADGTVVAWGNNDYGQCDVPEGLADVVAIAAGDAYCLALLADGSVAAWGNNDYGQCDMPEGLTVAAIDAGNGYNLMLLGSGEGEDDTTPPEIQGCEETHVVFSQNGVDAVVDYRDWITVTDDTDLEPTVEFDPASGSTLPIGDTAVTVTAWDAAGNTNTCEFTVSVVAAAYLEVSRAEVNVREGGEGRFFVRLAAAPAGSVVVTVARVDGDTNLTVKSGAVRAFKPSNWDAWQAVVLAAATDANATNETAAFQLSAPGYVDTQVTATVLDDDIGDNLALPASGSTLSGSRAYQLAQVVDGVHTSSAAYGYTIWTNDPPGTMTLDLRGATTLTRVRLLNWDWTYRVNRYQLEASADGAAWTDLAEDAHETDRQGWDDWAVAVDPVRYVRFTGLSGSANQCVVLSELEVYGTPEPLPALEVSKATVNVREAGEGRFFVRLAAAPAANVTVTVARSGGDTNLTVTGGAVRVFKPSNWDVWQAVVLAAGADANADSETATFQVSAAGYADTVVTATTLDEELGENLARAAGTTVKGWRAKQVANAVDGVHTASANYAYTIWTNDPPGTLTVDLKSLKNLTRVRLLTWDWTYRVNRYQLEASADGAVWTDLATDAHETDRQGWDDWTVTGEPVRYVRFTGLYSSANQCAALSELEIYGEAPLLMRRSAAVKETVAVASAPVSVLTSVGPEDETGWNAVDGDPSTVWTGQKSSGGYLVVEYAPALTLRALEVDLAEGSPANIEYLYSQDAEEWLPLPEGLETNQVSLNYLWLVFPDGGAEIPPGVLEIRPNP